MSVYSESFLITTNGFDDVIDITSKIQYIASNAKVKDGIVNVISNGTTSSVVVLENTPNVASDLTKLLEAIVPINKIYQHDNNWHDGNAFSHLRAAILGNNLTLPLVEYKVALDDCSQIVLIDFDNKQSNKKVVVTVVY